MEEGNLCYYVISCKSYKQFNECKNLPVLPPTHLIKFTVKAVLVLTMYTLTMAIEMTHSEEIIRTFRSYMLPWNQFVCQE